MKKFLLAALLVLGVSPAWAQNPQCPTRPVGDSSNACASTAFVQQNQPIPIVPPGTGDDCAAIQASFNAGNLAVGLLAKNYSCQSKLTMPSSGIIYGSGATLTKAANIDMIQLGDASQIHDLTLAGVGATFTGRGIICGVGSNQELFNVNIQDMNGYPYEITTNNTCTASSYYFGTWFSHVVSQAAFHGPPLDGALSGDRKFIGINNVGTLGYDFNGANTTLVLGCTSFGMTFSSNTRGATVTGCRLAVGTAITIDGQWTKFQGNIIGGNIVLAGTSTHTGVANNEIAGTVVLNAGATNSNFVNNQYTSITDNSGNSTNVILDNGKTGTGPVVLGNNPTLVGPSLGVATATSINGLGLSGSSSSITVNAGKTVTIGSSMTLFAGADGQTFTFPATTDTIMGLGSAQTVTNNKVFNAGTLLLSGATSGGLAYFNGTAVTSSALLGTNCIVYGGGAGVAPATSSSFCPTVSSAGAVSIFNGLNATGSGVSNGISIANTITGAGNILIHTLIGNVNGGISIQGQNNAYQAIVTASGGVFVGDFNQQYISITGGNTLAILKAFTANMATLGVAPNGTVTEASTFVADSFSMQHSGSPTLAFTSAYGFKANNLGANLTAGVTIGTSYGVWIAKQTNASTNYELWIDTTAPIVAFASGGLSVGTSSTDPAAGGLNLTGQIYIPNITTSSAAQTGTVCWTSGGSPAGKFTADTTLGCLASSARWKQDIHPLNDVTADVMALRPVTYRWRQPIDAAQEGEQIGLVAEDTWNIDHRLAGLGSDGLPKAWRQDAVISLLVRFVQQLKYDNDNIRAQLKTGIAQ